MDQPERVLLIRPSALGDVGRTVPALVTIRRALPDAHIDWLVQESFADVIRHHPALTGIVNFPRRTLGQLSPAGLGQFRTWARQLRDSHYDLVIDLQGLARSGLFTWLTRAPRRIGYANARELGWVGYNRRHHVDARLHTVDRMLELLRLANFDPVHDMRLYVGAADRDWLTSYLAETGVSDGGYFVVAPTARWLCKCWPIERYAAVATKLLECGSAGEHVVILASPTERSYLKPLLDALPADRVHLPDTTVGRMMAVLSQARLVLCNDSAPLHIAVGFDRRIVTIFGPTDPSLVGPYRRPETVVQPPGIGAMGPRAYRQQKDDQSLISRVDVEAVWQRIETVLS